jgi:hypothetical protein
MSKVRKIRLKTIYLSTRRLVLREFNIGVRDQQWCTGRSLSTFIRNRTDIKLSVRVLLVLIIRKKIPIMEDSCEPSNEQMEAGENDDVSGESTTTVSDEDGDKKPRALPSKKRRLV